MDAYILKSTTTFKIILSLKICHSFLRRFITQRHSQFDDSRFSSSAQSIFKVQFLQSFYGLYSPKTELNFPQKGLNNSQMGLNSPHKGLNYPQTGLNTPQTGLNNRPIQGYRRHFVKGAKPLGRARGQTNGDAFTMPKHARCCVGFCDNDKQFPNLLVVRSHVKELKFHRWPKDPNLAELWRKQVAKGRSDNFNPEVKSKNPISKIRLISSTL